jgi:hypothetical protein
MVALCDHSIIHPDLLDYFVEHQGQWPEPGHSGSIDLLWRYIKSDIEQADHVVVNSDFVKESFLHMGWDKNIVHALYWASMTALSKAYRRLGSARKMTSMKFQHLFLQDISVLRNCVQAFIVCVDKVHPSSDQLLANA